MIYYTTNILKSILKPFKAVLSGFKKLIDKIFKRNKKDEPSVWLYLISKLNELNQDYTLEYNDEYFKIKTKNKEED